MYRSVDSIYNPVVLVVLMLSTISPRRRPPVTVKSAKVDAGFGLSARCKRIEPCFVACFVYIYMNRLQHLPRAMFYELPLRHTLENKRSMLSAANNSVSLRRDDVLMRLPLVVSTTVSALAGPRLLFLHRLTSRASPVALLEQVCASEEL